MNPQYGGPVFGRSSFCGSGHCVEVAQLPSGQVAVRDSKDLAHPQRVFTPDAWSAFIQGMKAGEFDFSLPEPSL